MQLLHTLNLRNHVFVSGGQKGEILQKMSQKSFSLLKDRRKRSQAGGGGGRYDLASLGPAASFGPAVSPGYAASQGSSASQGSATCEGSSLQVLPAVHVTPTVAISEADDDGKVSQYVLVIP